MLPQGVGSNPQIAEGGSIVGRQMSTRKLSKTFSLRNVGSTLKGVVGMVSKRQGTMADLGPLPDIQKALEYSKSDQKTFVNSPWNRVCHDLGVDASKGLSEEDVLKRLAEHGPNELEKDPPKPFWRMVLDQLSDLLVLMLLASVLVSAVLKEIPSAVAILLIVIGNACLGVAQEAKAAKALEALQKLTQPHSKVLRGGQVKMVDSNTLVPGDIVLMDSGDAVPADIRLTETSNFSSNEMPITGEPNDILKNANYIGGIQEEDEKKEGAEKKLTEANMVYMACSIREGRGKGVVVRTGMHTRMGEVAKLLKDADESVSPLQHKLHVLGSYLAYISLALAIVVLVVGVAWKRGVPEDSKDESTGRILLAMLEVSVAIVVAAVPEGLPAAVTITLSYGTNLMSKKNAQIMDLHAVETLGAASIICTDKTGTLTKGEMTAVKAWIDGDVFNITGTGYEPKGTIEHTPTNVSKSEPKEIVYPLCLAAVSCSNAKLSFDESKKEWICIGNTSERPLVVLAAKAGMNLDRISRIWRRLAENPFNSQRKMMSVLVINGDRQPDLGGAPFYSFVKGAPNIVVERCINIADAFGKVKPLDSERKKEILQVIDNYSSQAFRMLAIAYRPFDQEPRDSKPDSLESDLTLAGLVALMDPEREQVAPSIQKAHRAGIRVVMITGDYAKTAKAIAERIGLTSVPALPEQVVDCGKLRGPGDRLREIKDALEQKTITKEETQKLKEEQVNVQKIVDEITCRADVYARAQPTDKITIVESYQRQGFVCSMTGDGVNDAAALKTANIGVAMGITGTDVAKASASMVLTDDNFCSIVEAVEGGRTIYNNICKFCYYLLSTNGAELLTLIIASTILDLPTILTPLQILWLNLCTDGAPAIALAVEETEPGTMDEGPRPFTESIISPLMLTGICIHNVVLICLLLSVYMVGLHWHTGSAWADRPDGYGADGNDALREDYQKGVRMAQTMAINYITIAELLRAYTCRSLRRSIFSLGTNKWMHVSVLVAIAAMAFVSLCPGVRDDVFNMELLDGKSYGFVIGLSFVPCILDEILKAIFRATGFGERPCAQYPPQNSSVPVNIEMAKAGDGYAILQDQKKDEQKKLLANPTTNTTSTQKVA